MTAFNKNLGEPLKPLNVAEQRQKLNSEIQNLENINQALNQTLSSQLPDISSEK